MSEYSPFPVHVARARPRPLVRALALLLGLGACGGGGGSAPEASPNPPAPAPPVAGSELPTAAHAPLAFPDLLASSGPSAGTVLLRFGAPSGASNARAEAYEVRAQVRPLTVETVAAAPVVSVNVVPAAPGAPESLVVPGLEGGRTLQFALRARFAGVWGAFSPFVSARATDGGPPAPPASAIRVSAARTLDQAGATYLLVNDVNATGTAFRVTARDVTLDLGGHTVRYGTSPGTAYGVWTEYLYDSGTLTVLNGRIVQGAGQGAQSPAVLVRGGHAVRLSRLDVDVGGPDCHGILVYDGLTGALRIDHCTVACRTTVVSDRHFPGVAAIWLGGLEGAVEIDANRVTASPQWGIKLQGRSSSGDVLVHHNRIVGTKALVANGYALGIHKPKAHVFENEVRGESRGIHLDGQDNFGHEAWVEDNAITSQDQPNAEYPTHWTHGLKVEGASAARIRRNRVVALADPQHAEAIALDVGLGERSDVEISDNLFVAASSTPSMLAHAFSWSSGTLVAPNDIRVERNVFRTTDRAITRGWPARVGGTLRGNAFVHDASAGHAWSFEYVDVSDIWPSPGNRLVDSWMPGLATSVAQWAQPAAYELTREATLRVRVTLASGAPAVAAAVTITDRTGAPAASGSTDAQGQVDLLVVYERVVNGPTLDARGPFQVSATTTGGVASAAGVVVRGRTALSLQVGSPAAQVDQAPPPAPGAPSALPLSATRALAWWPAVADASGIAFYEVRLDGELVALSPTAAVLLGGLEPAKTYALTVRAVDAGGNASTSSPAATLTTRVEDRGP